MPSPSSPGSADSTRASDVPASTICSSANPTPGGEGCSPSGSPASPSQMTCETWVIHPDAHREGKAKTPSLDAEGRVRLRDPSLMIWKQDESCTLMGGTPPSVFSAEASPAKISQSPDNDEDSPAPAAASSTSTPASPGLFDPDGYSSRTYPGFSARMAVGTSESCLERWPTSGTAWLGGFSTHVTSECRSDADACSSSAVSLTAILEQPQNVPAKYSLSARAAQGIIRRAEKRGRTLPSHLAAALAAVARTTTTDRADGS